MIVALAPFGSVDSGCVQRNQKGHQKGKNVKEGVYLGHNLFYIYFIMKPPKRQEGESGENRE